MLGRLKKYLKVKDSHLLTSGLGASKAIVVKTKNSWLKKLSQFLKRRKRRRIKERNKRFNKMMMKF